MIKVTTEGITKNKRQTKYLLPDGREFDRVSDHKKILGDKWAMYSVGQYKGRDLAYSVLSTDRELLETQDTFKKIFNAETKKNSDEAKDRGTLMHEEIELALSLETVEDTKQRLTELLTMNPFAQYFLDLLTEGWELYQNETSFILEDGEFGIGGTFDVLLNKEEEYHLIDMKTSKKTKEERNNETYLEYGMQMGVYAVALCEKYKIPAANLRVSAHSGVIMLLPLSYLAGIQRYKKNLFRYLSHIFIFVRKANLKDSLRDNGTYEAGMQEYAWFVWQKDWKEEPRFRFIDNQPFIASKDNGSEALFDDFRYIS